ncbi:uncharacterized protein BJ171DRAFT_455632 [Polychytrium aggregatum]|uniref:uncharacterized protein n=1 Tax=Polychytrium aggregatum TaxID=110093 RepID=UPI0022FDE10B|nr:uncharacterized protein BJ171DRAFT_455632 [Polychytrium aggregatum]KAI9208350.1 hypothetical protein BJ171DRAFT_455632 [Polychytrium aggregatum]
MAGLCHPDGQIQIGLTPSETIALSLHCENQYTGSQSWLAALADQGNASASYILAKILQLDLDQDQVKWSEKEATKQQIFHHLENAANTSHPMALFHLAGCYHDGTGVDQDHTKAAGLYRSLAERGILQAQISLGQSYENGEGVDQDFNAAIEWYSKAEDQGSEDSRLHIHLTAVCLVNGFGTTEDEKKAASIFEQLANDGHSDSQLWIGVCYRWGLGVLPSRKKAFERFSMSADQGNSYGQWWVGFCYLNEYGVTRDELKAVEWYRKSADQDNRYGQYHLGNCYRNGYGVPQNINTAVFWYRKSAEQGFQDAIVSLKQFGQWP